ncbi:MAG TPA: transposase [Phycisphaerae bacterium]
MLAVHKRPFDPQRPVVCFDEKTKQLVGEIARPIPAAPGRVEAHDYEYVRNDTANLFLFVEPLRGWRHMSVTSRRTKLDFAKPMKELIDVHYLKAAQVTLVMDNLNTHRLGACTRHLRPTTRGG